MSQFEGYPEYKDSGVEWLGEVPAHWEVKRLRYVIELNPSKSEVRLLPSDSPVSFIPMEAVGDDGSLSLDQIRPIGEVLAGYTYVREGDVTIAKITPCFENGKGAVMRDLENQVGFGTTELIVMRPKADLATSDYLYRVVSSEPFRVLGESSMYGAGGQKRVPDNFVRDFTIAWPPYEEQVVLQSFLDHETARIDALIDEQKRLIELLKEKRQAVISHSVTKGVDPDVPMKDSGVEWLGEVPAHWKVAPLKHALEVVADVDHYMPSSVDSGVPYFMTGDLRSLVSEIDLASCKKISREEFLKLTKKVRTSKGDVIMARYATIGTVSYVDVDREFVVSYSCVTIRSRKDLAIGAYLFFYFQSDAFVQGVSKMINANTQDNVGVGDLKEVRVALPAIHEQKSVVHELKVKLVELDQIIKNVRTFIRLLVERRSALISAAVTGKIDVRNWQLSLPTEQPELSMVAEERAMYR